MQLKKSKSWDMNLHWLRDRENNKEFKVHWERGIYNTSDYFTKHHSISHHKNERPKYIKDKINALSSDLNLIFNNTHVGLQGCVNQLCDT